MNYNIVISSHMKIKNKYLRNRAFRSKHWNRIRSKSHPFETYSPFLNGWNCFSYEQQVKSHFKWIDQQSRAIENGCHAGIFHSTSSFRRILNKQRKAKERMAMQKIRLGEYDVEVPKFKRDADWLYF